MICCRKTRISASNAARGRIRSTTIEKIILQRSNIPQRIIRFCVSRQLHGIYDRDSIQDAAGQCLAHADHIVGQDRDPSIAIRLAKRMIVSGEMPTPEQARARLQAELKRKRKRKPKSEYLGEPFVMEAPQPVHAARQGLRDKT
jgi:hypothetical protein